MRCAVFTYIVPLYLRITRAFLLRYVTCEALRWVERLGFYFVGLVFVCDVAGGTTDKRQHDQ